MFSAETARLALYLAEWVWTVVVLGVIPNRLIQRAQPLASGTGRGDVCSKRSELAAVTSGYVRRERIHARCAPQSSPLLTLGANLQIAWAAIAFAVLTIAIVWHLLDYCTAKVLPNNVEMVMFGWLSLWWFVAGVTFAAVKARNAPPAATLITVFSWMLCIMCFGSAVIAVRTASDAPASSRSNVRTVEDMA